MNLERVVKELKNGPVTFRTKGNSMTPKVHSGDEVTVAPFEGTPRKGDIVLAKVKGRYYLHLVTAVEESKRRVQISNNHGHVNGWTSFDKVKGIKT